MANKVAYRKNRQNRFGMLLVSLVVIMLLAVVAYKSRELVATRDEKFNRITELETQIEDEKKRSEEIAEQEKYMKTKKFVEDEAKSKFGLVYEDELIFKDESK